MFYFLIQLLTNRHRCLFGFQWGSFDGSTNPPVAYPSGTSIKEIEARVLIQINPATLPAAHVSQEYSVALSAIGAQPPLTWALSPSSAGLPLGLELLANGTIQGTPWVEGVYDILVRMTDTNGRFVDQPYALTVLSP